MNSAGLAGTVLMILGFVVFAMTVYAFVHAAMQRSDAYTAAGKLTKPVWLVILGVSALLSFPYLGLLSIMGPIIAACAAGVYVVDVRPKLLEIQGKSR